MMNICGNMDGQKYSQTLKRIWKFILCKTVTLIKLALQ